MPVQIPEAFACLFDPTPKYKVFYGGRGGAKSHNIARALLVLGMQSPIRVLCAREIQKSIKDSVHRLLKDLILEHDWEGFYTVTDTEIRARNGTNFIFAGLRHNVRGIKSCEGVDIAWVEEAENVSDNSWEILIPTLRKEGAQIWVSFNPLNPNDPTYVRFVKNAGSDTLAKKVSWRDNPFFPKVLEDERVKLQKLDPEAYAHIWEGEFDTRRSGAVYARLIAKARDEGRVVRVPYDPSSEVFMAWDLGYADSTAIWWLQFVGRELRWLDYYENSNEPLEHYVKIVKDKPYNYRRIAVGLPHDGGHNNIRGASIAQQLTQMGLLNTVLDREPDITAGIEMLRSTIGFSCFDGDKCKDGLHALESYAYEWDEDRAVFKKNPRHDWTSHAADAARYAARYAAQIKNTLGAVARKPQVHIVRRTKTSWMG